MNKHYAKGYRLERKSIEWLVEQGWAVPMSSRGSHGLFDLVAIYQPAVKELGADNAPSLQLIQVKANRLPDRPEMALLNDFWVPSGCVKVIHVWRDRATHPEVHIL